MAKRKQKSRVPKLSKDQLRLAQFPPNEGSWRCTVRRPYRDKPEEFWTCGMVNLASTQNCSLCKSPKPKKPMLLYPQYLKVMELLGLEVGTKFMVNDNGTKNGDWKFKRAEHWEPWTEEVFDRENTT